jgi:hypothetical protein
MSANPATVTPSTLETATAPIVTTAAQLQLVKVEQKTETPAVSVTTAPATGAINAPTGTMVGLMLTSFWKSPTVRWILAFLTLLWGYVGTQVTPLLTVAGPINWTAIWRIVQPVLITTALGAMGLGARVHDNNPVNSPITSAAKP